MGFQLLSAGRGASAAELTTERNENTFVRILVAASHFNSDKLIQNYNNLVVMK